jgi:hypothetical protein
MIGHENLTVRPAMIKTDDEKSFDQVNNGQTGINPRTGLANDFLNQYNEIIMLLEILPDDPDGLEDILNWHPLSYDAHFRASGLYDSGRVLAAYAHSPQSVRVRFERLLEELNHMLARSLGNLIAAAQSAAGNTESLRGASEALAAEVRREARVLRAIIAADAEPTAAPSKAVFSEMIAQRAVA